MSRTKYSRSGGGVETDWVPGTVYTAVVGVLVTVDVGVGVVKYPSTLGVEAGVVGGDLAGGREGVSLCLGAVEVGTVTVDPASPGAWYTGGSPVSSEIAAVLAAITSNPGSVLVSGPLTELNVATLDWGEDTLRCSLLGLPAIEV